MGNQCFSTDIDKNSDYLHVKIQTWRSSVLPDIKQISLCEKLEYICQKKCVIAFNQAKSISLNTSLPNKEKKYIMIIEILPNKKQKKFILKPNKNVLYQKILCKSHIPLNRTFVFGCTQYKLVKFVKDQLYKEQEIKTVTLLEQRIRQIKNMGQIQSCTSILNQNQPTCRICMQKQESKDNPLVSPCDCSGSLQYIHLNCWMEWAFKKSFKQQNYFITHIQKETCQLCKKSLLESQIYREAVGTILSNHSNIQVPFIVLQGQCPDPKNNYVLFKFNYIVISFKNKKSFSMGRSKNQDICLSMDYSMSRKNGIISLQNDQIYLQDCNSKHGIYMKPESQIVIDIDKQPQVYRFQNSLLTFSLHKK